jgi:type I restriction enzyme, R subunit
MGSARCFLPTAWRLVKQVVNASPTHLPASSPVNLVAEKHEEGRVYVSTYLTRMGLIEEIEDGQRCFCVGTST